MLVLPKLEDLQILQVTPSQAIDRIFNPSTLPALRALAHYDHEVETDGIENMLDEFSSQLTFLSLDSAIIPHLSSVLHAKVDFKTLFDLPIELPLVNSRAQHLRLFLNGFSATSDIALDTWNDTLETLATATPPLPTCLYLPPLSGFATQLPAEDSSEDSSGDVLDL